MKKLILSMALLLPMAAQVDNGIIEGTVQDATGLPFREPPSRSPKPKPTSASKC
jgi:hypothetical protein